MKTTLRNSMVLLMLIFLSACGSGVKLDEPNVPIEDRTTQTNNNASARSVAQVDVARDPLNDPQGALAKRSIYFDYDSYLVKDEYRATLEAHGKYLLANKGRKILIQGNTDERGGSEYNLALGQKRAEAVSKALQTLGVPESQLEAVSLGKEKPKALGHDEAAWAENRRADLVYQ